MKERGEVKGFYMSYNPNPIDTSGVKLPEQLADLTELLSENTHEIWAKQRLKDG